MAAQLRFADKVAVVTGGCSGIGKACADLFVEEGGKVAVLDINDELGREINKTEDMRYIHCDVTKDEDVQDAVEVTIKNFGKIDCLINCAGIASRDSIDDDDILSKLQQVIGIHVISCCRVIKHAIPHLRKTKGSVVNIASSVADIGAKNSLSYASAKGAVLSMTKAMALDEVNHGVRVNSISPGPTSTILLENFCNNDPSVWETTKTCTQMNRLADPREIAMTCLYLAVDATYSTGSDILVTGGQELGFGVKV